MNGAELCGELHSGIPELGLELGFDPNEKGSGAYLLMLGEDEDEEEDDDDEDDEDDEEEEEEEDDEDEK